MKSEPVNDIIKKIVCKDMGVFMEDKMFYHYFSAKDDLLNTLSDIFDIILNTVETRRIGIIALDIIFPIRVIENKIIGCITLADTILPVVNINVISIG